MNCWVVIPAYNEQDAIAEVVMGVPRTFSSQLRIRILLVNDGSSDQTEPRAVQAGVDAVLRFEENRGLGAAIRSGLSWVYQQGADLAVMIDGDNEYPAAQIPQLIDPILEGKADYVIGSRFKGTISGMKWHRKIGNYCFTLLQMILLRRWIYDGQSGMRAFSRQALGDVEIIHDYNYAQVMTLNLVRKGYRLLEVPIDYKVRTTGNSFIKFSAYMTNVFPAMVKEIRRSPYDLRSNSQGTVHGITPVPKNLSSEYRIKQE